MAYLNFVSRILAFSDTKSSANPQRRICDWSRNFTAIPVWRPLNQVFELQPFEEIGVFDSTRTLSYDGTTEFSLSLVNGTVDIYRLAWTGTGTSPIFRVDRALGLTDSIVIVPQNNQTALVTNVEMVTGPSGPSGPQVPQNKPSFGGVQVGDTVYIPGLTTGDTASFSPMNEGYWVVLGVSSDLTTLTIGRTPGTVYEAAADNVSISNASQFQVFGSSGVQIGDTLDLVSGFSAQALRSYEIIRLTASSVDFRSSFPLANQILIPGVSSLNVYSSAKTFITLETDQDLAVKFNGNTDESCRIEPFLAGNIVGVLHKCGTVYSLRLKNRSACICSVTLISVE